MKNGSVKGLVARGGFEISSMDWSDGEISSVTITSKLGGNMRLRSYVPLSGDGLQEARGMNTNPLYKTADIKEPLVSKEINPQYPLLYKVYEYDIMTQQGHSYTFKRGK